MYICSPAIKDLWDSSCSLSESAIWIFWHVTVYTLVYLRILASRTPTRACVCVCVCLWVCLCDENWVMSWWIGWEWWNCSQLLKSGRQAMIHWLWELLIEVWKMNQVPQKWKSAILIPLHKKKDRKDVRERGMAFLSIPGKVPLSYSLRGGRP